MTCNPRTSAAARMVALLTLLTTGGATTLAAQARAAGAGAFDRAHPEAAALLNGFESGYAWLFDRMLTVAQSDADGLGSSARAELIQRIDRGPSARPAMATAMQAFQASAPRAATVIARGHALHRQVYDIYADERVTDKAAAVEEAIAAYRSEPAVALPTTPKSMDILREHDSALDFRRRMMDANSAVWTTRWFQLALYEPLLLARTAEERRSGVETAVERFRAKLEDPLASPTEMPTPAAIAPELVAKHPRLAAIFDNLHMLEDGIADILSNPTVANKPQHIEALVSGFVDPSHQMTNQLDWIAMSLRHGIFNQGGPALGELARSERNRAPAPVDHASHGSPVLPGMGRGTPPPTPPQEHPQH